MGWLCDRWPELRFTECAVALTVRSEKPETGKSKSSEQKDHSRFS